MQKLDEYFLNEAKELNYDLKYTSGVTDEIRLQTIEKVLDGICRWCGRITERCQCTEDI